MKGTTRPDPLMPHDLPWHAQKLSESDNHSSKYGTDLCAGKQVHGTTVQRNASKSSHRDFTTNIILERSSLQVEARLYDWFAHTQKRVCQQHPLGDARELRIKGGGGGGEAIKEGGWGGGWVGVWGDGGGGV